MRTGVMLPPSVAFFEKPFAAEALIVRSVRCCEPVKSAACSARGLITLTTVGVLKRVASEKFVRALTFQRRFRGFSKKDRYAPSDPGDNPFGDRVFRSPARALGLIVRSTAEQEIQVPRER